MAAWTWFASLLAAASGCSVPDDDPTDGPTPERGRLIGTTETGLQSAAVTNAQLQAIGSTIEVEYDVVAQRITYWSPDADGELTELSALVTYPRDADDSLPVLSYQHGTLTLRDSAPSLVEPGVTSITTHPEGGLAMILAARGYVVVAPDYVGLGVSGGFHPYLHAATEATAVVDALRATHEFAAEEGLGLNDQLFLTGLSQGGHATMAAHRAIEQEYDDELTVTAAAPVAGPYRLSDTAVDGILASDESPHPYQVAYLLVAYNRIYEFVPGDANVFAEEVADTLPAMFDGAHEPDDIDVAMVPVGAVPPKPPNASISPTLLAAMAEDEAHPLRVALRENDVDDWSPRAPIHLYHCSGDRDVPFEISEATLANLRDNGGDVELIEPPDAVGASHTDCFPPSLADIDDWFASFR